MTTISTTGTLSSPGIGSGLDVNSIVTQLMAIERQPITDLQNKQTTYQTQLSAFGQIQSALATFQTAVQALSNPTKFQVFTGTASDSSVVSATATASATPASYQIEISQLSQQNKIGSGAFASTSDVIGTGSLTIEFGTYDGTAGTFTSNASKTPVSITIDSTNNTLSGIRDAINNANAGVGASIINDGTGSRLVLTSKDSGAVNSIKIRTTDGDGNNTDSTGLSALAYDPTANSGSGKNLTLLTEARNALFTIDGISISKPSNTVTDAIEGVTLNLTQTNVGQPVSLSINSDTKTVSDAVQAMVKAYNVVNTTLHNLTAYDAANNKASVLTGDSTVRSIASNLRSILTGFTSSSFSSLSQVGVTFQPDGTLSVDSTKLQSAFDSNFNSVASLFASNSTATGSDVGIATQLDQYLGNALGSTGSITSRTDGLNSTIKQLTNQQADMETRMTAIEKRYRAQFTNLDAMLSSMNTTSTFLTQQLAALTNQNSNK